MKIFVTGGAGFIGKWLIRCLPTDAEIVIVDSIDEQVHKSQSEFAPEQLERALCIKADIRDQDAYASAMEGSDVIVHLASQTGTGQSMYEISKYIQHNVDGTAKLLEVISKLLHKPRRIVLTSSRAVYGEGAFTNGSSVQYSKGRNLEDLQSGKWEIYDNGQELSPLPMKEDYLPNPTSIYGLTKLWQEQLISNYAQNQNIDYTIFRLQNVYGPEQELRNPYTGIIGIFTSLITQKGEVELFEDGKMTRDFVYVKDVAMALKAAIYYQNDLSTIINVGSGKATSLLELVNLIANVAGKDLKINYSGRFRVGDIRHAVADMSRYVDVFSEFQPTSLEEGMVSYLKWYFEQDPLSHGALIESLAEMEKKKLLLTSK
ncbi:MAG: NAD-dependent epimerase/dehydratase family protein [Calothrix sp. C42_A2020_038]|nr:NAD-dependent epimerase/dehydratase family protein [Calothrix sp. C42_A2020_038]